MAAASPLGLYRLASHFEWELHAQMGSVLTPVSDLAKSPKTLAHLLPVLSNKTQDTLKAIQATADKLLAFSHEHPEIAEELSATEFVAAAHQTILLFARLHASAKTESDISLAICKACVILLEMPKAPTDKAVEVRASLTKVPAQSKTLDQILQEAFDP